MMNNQISKNKKALSMMMIIALMISSITLVILFLYINSQVENYRYSESIIACSFLFKNIDGKPTYFGSGLDTISPKLIDEIAKQCSSKKIEITSKSINSAAELISNCYAKTGSGEDIFGANVKNQKVCLYCGEIKAKEDIINFRTKLNTELKKPKYSSIYSKESEIENYNEFNMQLVPKDLKTGESTTVFYYVYRTDIAKNADFKTFAKDMYLSSLSKLVGDIGPISTTLNFYASENVLKTYGGIILTKTIENKDETDLKQFTNSISKEDCTVIIPIKNYK